MHHREGHNLHKIKREYPAPWPQGDIIAEPKGRASDLPPEGMECFEHNEVISNYEPEPSEPHAKSDTQEEKVDSNAEYAAMVLPQDGTQESGIKYRDVYQMIQCVHTAQGPEIVASWLQMYEWLDISP